MFHEEYGDIPERNLKWLSKFSGMALLNWGFHDYQIREIYQYRDIVTPVAALTRLYESEKYLESGMQLSTNIPHKYLDYNSNLSLEDNIPKFGRDEKIALSRYSHAALKSWGFSESLIFAIFLFIREPLSDSVQNPNLRWIALSYKYGDSVYPLNNSSVFRRLSVNPSIANFRYTSSPTLWPTEVADASSQDENQRYDSITIPQLFPRRNNRTIGLEEEPLSAINEAPPVAIRERPTETARDLTVKYLNTYGIYRDKIALITSIEEDRNTDVGYTIYIKIFNANGTTKSENIRTGISELNMSVPKLGFINHEGIAWHIERNYKKSSPEKYRRGLVSGSINILNISDNDYFVAYGIEHTYSPSIIGNEGTLQYLLYPLFFPKFFSYTEALSKINNYELLSCAITSSISIALNFKLNKIVLYKNRWAIGTYSEKNKKFIMNIDIFNSDLERAGVII
jgi:hypothetical protein